MNQYPRSRQRPGATITSLRKGERYCSQRGYFGGFFSFLDCGYSHEPSRFFPFPVDLVQKSRLDWRGFCSPQFLKTFSSDLPPFLPVGREMGTLPHLRNELCSTRDSTNNRREGTQNCVVLEDSFSLPGSSLWRRNVNTTYIKKHQRPEIIKENQALLTCEERRRMQLGHSYLRFFPFSNGF